VNRRLIAAIGTAALMFSVAACSSSSKSTSGSGSSSSAAAGGKTLTVWLMTGDNPADWVANVTAQFKAANPGDKINIDIQQWASITTKITTALSQNNPPDIIDIGNTDTPFYAASGGLLDLTSLKSELGGDGWTPSMNGSTVYNGKQYAAPWYAGGRAVMYNKLLWAKAGLTTPPTTMAAYEADLTKLKSTAGVTSALYLPGQYWYVFDGLLQQAGANIATESGSTWSGTLNTPAALSAANTFKTLQSFGTAPKDQDETTQDTFFEKGNVATMIAMGYEQSAITTANPKLANEIGWFPIPSNTPGTPGKTFLGGSNLAISANSQNKTLAESFLKIALDQANESDFAKDTGFLPNTSADYSALAGNAYAQAYEQAAPEAGYTPLIPTWSNVENTPNPITTLFLTPVLEGKNPATAAAAADAQIASRLNTQQ